MTSSPSPSQLLELYASASSARALSYSPYSKFRVGCSFLLQDGSYIQGANVENASYGGCICAERTALLKIVTDGNGPKDRGFIALAVAADIDAPCTPCGICRQFIREFCPQEMPIHMVPSSYDPKNPDATKIVKSSLAELLPMSFGPEDLDRPRE